MSAKNKHKGKPAANNAAGPPRQEVDRLIARGWLKDAVKAAKICFRDHPSPEHHHLLERATLLRAQELHAGGMTTAARDVATHLLDLKVTDPDLIEPVIALLVGVGMAGEALKLQGRLESPEAVDRLNRQAADQAVLHPERSAGVAPEIIAGAKQIREALELLTAGDESGALDRLRSVSRTSLFADWRLFARGLAASRRGDDAEAHANWDRLDATRAGARIAQTLSAVTDPSPGSDPTASKAKREKLERWAFGEPLIGPLQDAAQAALQGDWDDVIQKLGLLRLSFRRYDPALAVRLTQAVIFPLSRSAMSRGYHDAKNLIQRFTKATEPLPIDPHWHRFWALVWEGPQGHIEDAEPFWRQYLASLESVPAIRAEDRNLVRALILTHLGEAYVDYAASGADESPLSQIRAEAAHDRSQAITNLEASLKYLPTHRPTYEALMSLYENAEELDRVADIARRLLAVLPSDFDALELLADHHLQRDEPGVALDYARRARKIKPLDRAAISQEWVCLVAEARQLALAKQYDAARANMAAAAQLDPVESVTPSFLARQTALEFKAGNAARAEEILADTMNRLEESTSFFLALAIEARRYKLPKPLVDRFEAHWSAESVKRVQGKVAGALATLMQSFLATKIKYTGQKEHFRQVLAYLKRTSRTKYDREDLGRVCTYLATDQGDRKVSEQLAKRGVKLFPRAPEFPLTLGMIELSKGPAGSRIWQAKSFLQSALKLALAQEQTDPIAARIIPKVREILSSISQLNQNPFGFFSFPGTPGTPPGPQGSFFESFARAMGGYRDDDEDEEFDDEDELPMPPPPPGPKRKKGKKS